VPTRSINEVIQTAGEHIRVCKIDCEGAELEIIRAVSEPERVEAFAIEFHPYTYPLDELIAALLRWGTHQVHFAPRAEVIYAVREDCLKARAVAFYEKGSDTRG
jgi:hypothetical protein